MKRTHLIITILMIVLLALAFTACTPDAPVTPDDGNTEATIVVTALVSEYTTADIDTVDFGTLFSITKDGEAQQLIADYLRLTTQEDGKVLVECTFEGVSASLVVTTISAPIQHELSVTVYPTTLTIKQLAVEGYDFNTLFNVSLDGEAVDCTLWTVDQNVDSVPGNYTYTVTYLDASATLSVVVEPQHSVEVLHTYRNPTFTLEALSTLDYTTLFSLYVDGVPTPVLPAYLTYTVAEPAVGDLIPVTLLYTTSDETVSISGTTTVEVVSPDALVLTGSDEVVYLNCIPLDVTELFSITVGNKSIPVTTSMISGSIDYTTGGTYTLTLTYMEQTATANVTVQDGAVVSYATADTITIRKGTDQASYPFNEDVIVVANGVRLYNTSASQWDLSAVDFSEVGDYTATFTLLYNDQPMSLSGVKFTTITKELTYHVVDTDYSIVRKEENVLLPQGTTQYDLLSNLSVKINGRNQKLVFDPELVGTSRITCYVSLLSQPIDFASPGLQEVRLAVYVNGITGEPVEASYTLRIQSDVQVTAHSISIFEGRLLHIKELFTITDAGAPVAITGDMLSGRVDVFTPGVYQVGVSYRGVEATADVVVLHSDLLGTFTTRLTTIPRDAVEDEDGGIISEANRGVRLGDLIIREDGTMTVNNQNAIITGALDESTLTFTIGISKYTLHYQDGIVFINPNNALRQTFSDGTRPLIYFADDTYNVRRKVTINKGYKYVLSDTTNNYSIDTFLIERLADGSTFWYALKVNQVYHMSSDTVYEVTHGMCTYLDDLNPVEGAYGTLSLHGELYPFNMTSGSEGKVDSQPAVNPWTNQSFAGTYDGKSATLAFNQYGHLTFIAGGTEVFYVNTTLSYNSSAVFDYEAGTALAFDLTGKEKYGIYSYKFSLDSDTHTFSYIPRDSYYGKYQLGGAYIFLDGYGTGRMHFDTSTYNETKLTYSVNNGVLTTQFYDTEPTFAYGAGCSYYISPLLNVLTVRSAWSDDQMGLEYVNSIMTDGAIVTISTTSIPQGAGKGALVDAITITTPAGVMDKSEVTNLVKTNLVSFTKAGVYKYSITIPVAGTPVTSHYAIQIVGADYTGHPLATNWDEGILGTGARLVVDECGITTLTITGETYRGIATLAENGLTAQLYNARHQRITLKGTLLADGLLSVNASGSLNLNEAYTTGTARKAGTTGFILRELNIGGIIYHYVATSADVLGSLVTTVGAESESAFSALSTITLTDGTATYYAILNAWGDTTSGITLADEYRGTYTSGERTLEITGFGVAILDGISYTYHGKGALTLVSGSDVHIIRVKDATFTEVEITIDNSLLQGSTFYATPTFFCGEYPYRASTRFAFGPNGKVDITSTSAEHDNGEDACGEDQYAPSFVGEGSYSLVGEILTITVGVHTFAMHIDNLLYLEEFVCQSTTLTSGAHGYFAVGTKFEREV